jgi:hypothetical protein
VVARARCRGAVQGCGSTEVMRVTMGQRLRKRSPDEGGDA